MDRINGAGHVGRRFVAEDADLGRPPTLITDAWLNSVQEEIVNVILAPGETLDGAQENQLLKAINMLTQKASAVSAAASGTVDAITANFVPAIAALTDHLLLIVRAGGANTSPTPTFTPASATIPPKTIVKGHNQALVAGDVSGAGFRAELQYDATLDKWVLLNPATGVNIASLPVGMQAYFPSTTAPAGWIKRNGALISRTAFADLYAFAVASGNIVADGVWQAGNFSYGDGATTFRIPDGRSEFERGWDDGRGVDAGRAIGSAQADEIKSHNHVTVLPDGSIGSPGGAAASISGNLTANYTSSNTGGTETRPRNVAALACIKY